MTSTKRRNIFLLAAIAGVAMTLLLRHLQDDQRRADAAQAESTRAAEPQPIVLPLKFDPVRTQGDFRLTLLGASKDVGFSQSAMYEGSDRSGEYVTPMLSFQFLLEYLGEGSLDDAISEGWDGTQFEAFAPDGRPLVGKRTVESVVQNKLVRHAASGSGTKVIDLSSRYLRSQLDPAPMPDLDDPEKGKVFIRTLFGDALNVHQARLVYHIGPKDDRTKFVFENVPIP